MERLSAAARDAFRETVYDNPRFLAYFNTATPVAELDAMHIGSRPAQRESQAALQALRAIPWQFAWMQTRLLLPSWLGVEEASRTMPTGRCAARCTERGRSSDRRSS